jgi:hypothetical protein
MPSNPTTAAGRVCAFEKSTNVSKPAGHQSTSSEKRLDAPTATPTLKTALKVSDGPSSVGSVGRTHSTEILAALRQPANHLYIHAFKVLLSCRMLHLLLLPCCRHHSQTQASRTPSAVAVRSGSGRIQPMRNRRNAFELLHFWFVFAKTSEMDPCKTASVRGIPPNPPHQIPPALTAVSLIDAPHEAG